MRESQENSIVIEMTKNENETLVVLSGSLDEFSDLSAIKSYQGRHIIFDFEKLEMLNSLGLRDWILLMKEIPTSIAITFRHIPPKVMEQVNILKGFIPARAHVQSLFVPFVCPKCDDSVVHLLHSGKDFSIRTADAPMRIDLPNLSCQHDGEDLEADILQAKYFYFLAA